ncbi:hypothetical protein AB0D99_13865 [Streptomyces sp. NPDC047971]|uniref:hypothetical protein n=1 Tax=Streptomyces sp. NPDC047971 TaxID=3154499 RepID=UPI0033DBCDD8
MRAATFAALCVLLAATGHVLMSERSVPGWALALAFVGTVTVAWALAGRERGPFVVTATTVAVQSVLHTVFSWSQPAGDAHAHTANTVMGQGHMGHMAMSHASAAGSASTHEMTDLSSSFGMVSAHLLAAVVSGLWLAYGERAAFRLLRALPAALFRPLRLLFTTVSAVAVSRPRLRLVRAGDERAPSRLLLAHSVVTRGPPQAIAVL